MILYNQDMARNFEKSEILYFLAHKSTFLVLRITPKMGLSLYCDQNFNAHSKDTKK